MMNLKQITNLINRGERIVVVNERLEPRFVVMNISEYKNLADVENKNIKGLTEEELLIKINRDIAVWRADQEGDKNFDFNAADKKYLDTIDELKSDGDD